MEKIDLSTRDVNFWAICETLGGVSDEVMDTIIKPGQDLYVELRLNGVEVSFSKLIKAFDDDLEYRATQKAQNMILERAAGLSKNLMELEAKIKESVQSLFPEYKVE